MKWAACFICLLGLHGANGQHSVSFLNTLPSSVKVSSSRPSANRGSEELIPFEICRGMIVVQAELNGEKGDFIVDTGAPLMVINKTPAAEARKEARSIANAIVYAAEVIDHFQWSKMSYQNLDALALDISHLESSTQRPLSGMVGYNALQLYEVLFDYRQNRMALYDARKNALHRAASPIMEIPFELQDHLPVVIIQAGKQKLAFGIDTGAGVNLVDRRWLDDLPANKLKVLQQEEVRGVDQQMQVVPAARISDLSLEAMPLNGEMDFLFTDLQHLNVSTGLKIDGLLGYPFLKNLVFSINFPKRKLYIWHVETAN